MTPLVIGLGQPDRGDDGVGPVVTRTLAQLGLPGFRVVEREDPTQLLDLWADHDPVVVVDAVRSGGVPGAIHLLRVGLAERALPSSAWRAAGHSGTHAFGLGPTVELARALGRLPQHLLVVGVEVGNLEQGTALSGPVDDAVDDAVALILEELGTRVPW